MLRPAIAVALCGLCLPAAARADAGFLAAPTDQLAVPGLAAGAELTPEGYVYTGAAEVSFRFGARLRPWNVPTRSRGASGTPVFVSTATSDGVRYRLTVLADALTGEPAVYARISMRNVGSRAVTARWANAVAWSGGEKQANGRYAFRYLRPATPAVAGLYLQPGEAFDRGAVNRIGGGTVTRDGRVLYTYSGTPAERRGPGRASGPGTRFGFTTYALRLARGATRSIELRLPVVPRAMSAADVRVLRGQAFAAHVANAQTAWRDALRPAATLELPEHAVERAYAASIVQLLEPRYQLPGGQWVQAVNKLQYHSFWLRDAAIIAQALDLAGLHDAAAQDLSFFSSWQQDGGLFISRAGQLDGHGQALWGLGEHVRLTGDADFARAWLPAVQRAMAWLADARSHDPLGLMPPSDPGDNELVAGHLAGDDFWAVAGSDAAAALADAAGRPDLAASWRAERDALRKAAIKVLRRRGGAIPPALDAPGGHDWGNLWAAWPYPVLAPRDRQVEATVRKVRRDFAEGIATYGTSLHGYLGFRVFETELAGGRQLRSVDGLYASLAHLTATDGCFELGTRPYGRRLISDDLAPHAWCSAEVVALLRTMLVRERGSGIQLLAAVSPRWLGHGRRIAFGPAPTRHGPVSVRLESTARGAKLTWVAREGTPLWWTVPAGARSVTVDGKKATGALVRLPSSRGTARIRWRLASDGRSLARTKRRLAAAYRRHGRPPPF